jgi:hypothetical protein
LNFAVRRFLKAALLSFVALLMAGLLALWVFIDREASAPELKPRIEAAATEFFGRPLTIDALEWRRWPDATLVGRNVRLYEDSGKRRLLADAPIVEAHLAVLSLFKLAAGISVLRFVSPRVSLRRGVDGEWNAARVVSEIAARPREPARSWGTLALNWFEVEGGTLTVEDDRGAWAALPPIAIRGSGKLRFGRRHFHFPFELAGRVARSEAALELSGDLGGHSRFRADLRNAEASLARPAWPAAARWKGRWDGSLRFDERPSVRWQARVRAAPLSVSTAAPTLDSLELTGEYVPSLQSSFTGVARSSTTDIDVKGSLLGDALELEIKSAQADAGVLLGFAGVLSASTGTSRGAGPSGRKGRAARAAAPPPRLRATVSAGDLKYGSAEARGLRAVVTRSTGPYVLEQMSFQSLGGSVTATGSYLPAGADDYLKLSWHATGVDIQALFYLAGSTHAAAGFADSNGALSTGVGARFLPGMNGKVSVDLKEGWFGGVPGLVKVLSRLNISTLFAEAAGRHRQRIPFNAAHGSVTITKGKIASDRPLILENKTLQMAFMGTYDLPSQTVDGKIVVNFLTVTDEIIHLIPGVRDILLGKEKGLIPIWLKVTGKADDPDIDILQLKTIEGPFWNAARRVLRLPKKLFEKLKPPKKSP